MFWGGLGCFHGPQNGVVLEEDTVWKCVFNLVYVHDNSKGKDRGLKNQGYMIT